MSNPNFQEQAMALVDQAFTERMKATKAKEQFIEMKRRIKRELEEIRTSHTTNSVRKTTTGAWLQEFHHAPEGTEQTLKRTKAEVGKDVASMLCRTDSLIELDYSKLNMLLLEYRDVHDKGLDQMWDLLDNALDTLRTLKHTISRQSAAARLRCILTPKMQVNFDKAFLSVI